MVNYISLNILNTSIHIFKPLIKIHNCHRCSFSCKLSKIIYVVISLHLEKVVTLNQMKAESKHYKLTSTAKDAFGQATPCSLIFQTMLSETDTIVIIELLILISNERRFMSSSLFTFDLTNRENVREDQRKGQSVRYEKESKGEDGEKSMAHGRNG